MNVIRPSFWFSAIAVAVLLAGCQSGGGESARKSADEQMASATDDAQRVRGEYLVELNSADASPELLERAFDQAGVESIGRLETSRPLYVIRVREDPGPEAMSRMAADEAGIARIQPNYRYESDPGSLKQLD